MKRYTRNPALLGMGVLALAGLLLASPPTMEAAGLLIADGGFGGRLKVVEHDVQVTVTSGIAITHVTQVFQNLEQRQVEALYTFPVPEKASVSNFSMWINGKEMVGEVLEKKRAREIYDSYKRRNIDPGLLEQVDYKTFEMRIFPIPAGARQRVQITYYQELDHDNDRATYVYPLATVTEGTAGSTTEGRFSINMDVQSLIPIVEMKSTSHGDDFVFVTHGQGYRQASLETREGDLNRDVVVSWALERPSTGFDLITSREQGEDGYFCLMLTVGEDLAELDQGMDYVFVLDVSGSMAHDGKLKLSRGSVASFIEALGEKDRFQVITFNAQPNRLFEDLQDVSRERLDAALQFLASQRARGGTVLSSALELAFEYGDPDRPLNVVVLSDGMTEQRNRAALLQLGRPKHARVYCIGVGNEVNRPLLEQLAEDAGGIAAFVSQQDDFAQKARAFRRKLTRPVATSVRIDFGGRSVYDVEPERLPNLYHGSPIRLYGRYRGDGPSRITLRAEVQGKELEQSLEMQFPRVEATNPEIERMWALTRVDRLLKEADRAGTRAGVIDEIIALGETYSIVTEYTSFLVLENDAEYQRWKIERRNLRRTRRDRDAQRELAANLEELRKKAVQSLGPQAAQPVEVAETPPTPRAQPQTRARPQVERQRPEQRRRSQPRRARRNGSSNNFRFGSGPVGPLFIGVAAVYLLMRRRKSDR